MCHQKLNYLFTPVSPTKWWASRTLLSMFPSALPLKPLNFSDGPDGDDDGDFMPGRMSRSWTRSRRTSSSSVHAPRHCLLSAPMPMPNLTKKPRRRRVSTAPVIIVQGGMQKNMRTYRCTVLYTNCKFCLLFYKLCPPIPASWWPMVQLVCLPLSVIRIAWLMSG